MPVGELGQRRGCRMKKSILPPDRVLCLHGGKITIGQLMLYLGNISGHKPELAAFVYNRLYEKYIEPYLVLEALKEHKDSLKAMLAGIAEKQGGTLEDSDTKVRTGFAIMTNMCLLIETLQGFRYGLQSSQDAGLELFNQFFREKNTESVFGKLGCNELDNKKEGFYASVRCGLLHQGETLHGWTINSSYEKALAPQTREINAQKFLKLMRAVLAGYKQELMNADLDSPLWNNYVLKLRTIIKNCEVPDNSQTKE